jgi:hypothetical protein
VLGRLTGPGLWMSFCIFKLVDSLCYCFSAYSFVVVNFVKKIEIDGKVVGNSMGRVEASY